MYIGYVYRLLLLHIIAIIGFVQSVYVALVEYIICIDMGLDLLSTEVCEPIGHSRCVQRMSCGFSHSLILSQGVLWVLGEKRRRVDELPRPFKRPRKSLESGSGNGISWLYNRFFLKDDSW